MSDVRSLLRSELASRKDPSSGSRLSKKRKIGNEDDPNHKKRRPIPVQTGKVEESESESAVKLKQPSITRSSHGREGVAEEEEEGQSENEEKANVDAANLRPNNNSQETAEDESEQPSSSGLPQAINEDEWAAFEREVAAPTRISQAPAALAAPATITAAPMSTEELATAEEERRADSRKAPTREAEVEGEREDAARSLEDEFDEMDQLEERVKVLKRKREELRRKNAVDNSSSKQEYPAEERPTVPADESSDDDDDQNADDWDTWRFGK